MNNHFLNRIETRWVPVLQDICDRYSGEMKLACVELQKQFLVFQKEKMALLSTIASTEGEEAALEAFTARLDNMLPSYLQQLLTLISTAGIPLSESNPNGAQAATETAPVVSVQGPASTKPSNGAATMGVPTDTQGKPVSKQHIPPRPRTMASFFAPRQQAIVNECSLPVLPELKNMTHPRLVLPTLSTWEVVGEEYVFQHAPFGPGWFVLRCDRGDFTKPVTFLDHPLDKSGLKHFNMSSCRYHDRSMVYTIDSIMERFGRRVVDEAGEDVTDAWAADSNEMLAEKMQKRAEKKNKV